MPPPAHDSDAESVLSHVSETSDEAEDGAPVRAQGDTEAESLMPAESRAAAAATHGPACRCQCRPAGAAENSYAAAPA